MRKTTIYRKPMNSNLFEDDITIERLSSIGNPLEQLSSLIDFELFRPTLEAVLVKEDCKTPAGRAQFDSVLMFKILILKRYYGLGNTGIEYQIVDRTSFRKFPGISTVDEVPADKTIWNYQEILTKNGTFDKLFDDFNAVLLSKRHKDIDARWTQKGGDDYYGYKVHTKVDKKTKLIKKHLTTPANVHDSHVVGDLLDDTDKGQTMHLDSGYAGQEDIIEAKGVIPVICEKGCRYKKLTQEQIDSNHEKSRIRCRIEHVYGFVEQSSYGCPERRIDRSNRHKLW